MHSDYIALNICRLNSRSTSGSPTIFSSSFPSYAEKYNHPVIHMKSNTVLFLFDFSVSRSTLRILCKSSGWMALGKPFKGHWRLAANVSSARLEIVTWKLSSRKLSSDEAWRCFYTWNSSVVDAEPVKMWTVCFLFWSAFKRMWGSCLEIFNSKSRIVSLIRGVHNSLFGFRSPLIFFSYQLDFQCKSRIKLYTSYCTHHSRSTS
jgi:hypothetical protein